MWILPVIGYTGLVGGFAFMVLAIASGLYYLSELVEEYTVVAKKVLTRMIYGIVGFQVLLLVVDKFPFGLTALSVLSHLVYLQNLRRFPLVKLSDPVFLLSCALVLLNHYVWFRHFSKPPPYSPSSSSYPYRRWTDDPYVHYPTFTEIASFFGVCVWLVPFSLFVSLSASENVLPTVGSDYNSGDGNGYGQAGRSTDGGKKERRGMAKAAVEGVRAFISENGEVMGFWKGDRTRNRF